MSVLEILPDIYSVGVIDWNVRTFKYVPDENEIKQCFEYGKEFAQRIGG